jgi:hypothetical protein
MRIANLSPLIMDEWRAGRLDEAAAQAYANSTDHERQDIAWHLIDEHPYWTQQPRTIKEALGFTTARDARRGFDYVGRETYEAMGGVIEEDLFGEDFRIENEELLSELVIAKQMVELDAIRATLTRRNKTEADGANIQFTWVSEPPIHNGYVDYGLQVKLKGTKLPAKGSVVGTYKLLYDNAAEADVVTLEPTYWYASREDYNLAHPSDPMSVGKEKDKPTTSTGEVIEAEPADPGNPVLTQRAADQVRAQRADMLVNHISATKETQAVAHTALIYTMARSLIYPYNSKGDALGLVYNFEGLRFTYPGTSTETKPAYIEALKNIPGLTTRDALEGFDLFEEWSAGGGVDRVAALVFASKYQPQDGPGSTLVDYLFTELSEPLMARRSWIPNTAFFDCFRKGTLLAWIGSVHPNFATEFAKKKLDDIKDGIAFFFRADDDSAKRYGMSAKAVTDAKLWLPTWLRWHSLDEVKVKIEERRARHAALHGSDEEEAGDEDTPASQETEAVAQPVLADDTDALIEAAFEEETWPQDSAAQA